MTGLPLLVIFTQHIKTHDIFNFLGLKRVEILAKLFT